ncbi:MAG: acetyl-CoA carboxylase biotin carboxyl carrier protein subunit [Nitrososphaeraceae archaeon]
MKLEVNGIVYDIGITQHKVKINNRELDMIANMNEEKIMINGKTYHLDFEEEGEPSLMIINGMTYLVSKSSVSHISVRELKAPISGKVIDILSTKGIAIKEGQVLIILEAMKMEIQIKSPVSKEIREIKVSKGQSVKTGDVLIVFE